MEHAHNLLAQITTTTIPTLDLGPIQAPTPQKILSFAIRAIFIVAGLLSLAYLLMGAITYITSGGDKDNTSAAQKKIANAAIGLILVFVVLGVASLLETITGVGLGITKPIELPTLGTS